MPMTESQMLTLTFLDVGIWHQMTVNLSILNLDRNRLVGAPNVSKYPVLNTDDLIFEILGGHLSFYRATKIHDNTQ